MGKNLITGGLGFLGSRVAKRLLDDGEEVVLFDIATKSRFIKDIEEDKRLKIVQGDMRNFAQVIEAVKDNDIDCIYHLGALLANEAEASPQTAYEVNVNGTYHVLEAARLFKVSCVIFPSTISTYGPGIPDVVNEDVVQYPNNMYGVTKVIGERLGEYYYHRYGVNFRCVRFPAIVGPERTTGLSSYTSVMILEPAMGRVYRTYVDESVRCPFIYKNDAVNALVSLRYADEACLKRRVYNIEVISCTAGEEAAAVKKYLPEAKIEFHPDKKAVEILNAWAKDVDGTRAFQEWGFRLQYGLEETIKSVIDEVRKGNITG
ncbi:NAD-dependent epimerase/dehydratase family protein [Thermoanaerobacteraceae bacterium SP2]|nr:NAD-dependent epimerase/dehydratase family protein [Thermoanaerobacteraceae bacterium SP2]